MKGVSLTLPDSALVAKARDFLGHGPASAVDVIGHVCNLPAPPERVALHLAEVLLGRDRRFARDGEGRWQLARDASAGGGSRTVSGSVGLRDLRYVVVDVETTGVRAAGGDRIAEIAAVVVEGGEVSRVFESLVNPECPISPVMTRITRITSEMVREAPRFAEVAAQVGACLDGRVFVAHNASFDWRFLSAEVARVTGQRLDGDRLCTVRLTAALLPQLRRRSLDAVAHYLGVEIGARHRAGGDARATAAVLLRLLRLAEDRGVRTLDELATLGRPGSRRRRRRIASPTWMTRDEWA